MENAEDVLVPTVVLGELHGVSCSEVRA